MAALVLCSVIDARDLLVKLVFCLYVDNKSILKLLISDIFHIKQKICIIVTIKKECEFFVITFIELAGLLCLKISVLQTYGLILLV